MQTEHPGVRGFSTRNIWRMKTFYEVYEVNQFLPPQVAEIGWVQNCLIIEKCKDAIQREFYVRKTKQPPKSLERFSKIHTFCKFDIYKHT